MPAQRTKVDVPVARREARSGPVGGKGGSGSIYVGQGQAIPAPDQLVESETISNLDLCRGDKFSRNGRKTTCGRKSNWLRKTKRIVADLRHGDLEGPP